MVMMFVGDCGDSVPIPCIEIQWGGSFLFLLEPIAVKLFRLYFNMYSL